MSDRWEVSGRKQYLNRRKKFLTIRTVRRGCSLHRGSVPFNGGAGLDWITIDGDVEWMPFKRWINEITCEISPSLRVYDFIREFKTQ